MKRTDAGLSRHPNLALVAALLVALVFAGTVAAAPAEPLAPDVPNLPHCFWGTVTTNRGVPLPGMTVMARAVSGYWTGQVTTSVNLQGQYSLCVPGYDSSTGAGAKQGDLIGFYVNGGLSLLVDVATGRTYTAYPLVYGGTTHLNLFVPLQETITATAGPGGTITPEGSVKVDYGTSQTFTFTPDACWKVDQVLVDGTPNPEAAAAGSYTFSNVRGSHTIHVTFIQLSYTATPTWGSGGVIVPGTPQTVLCGDSVTFEMKPNACYAVDNVLVNGSPQGAITTYTFSNVTTDATIFASFKLLTLTITPSAGPGGSINPNVQQTGNCGESKTFTFLPDTGYMVDDVKVDGVSNPAAVAAGSYTFTNVSGEHTIAVTFKPLAVSGFRLYLPLVVQ